MQNCRTADRNICAPGNQISALFVDIDGTVMKCQQYFDDAENEFCRLMSLCGFDPRHARAVFKEVYYGSMPHRGYENHRFAEALAEAYHQICREKKKRRDKLITAICTRIGSAPFFKKPELFNDVLPVLTRARHNFMIVAVTVGSRDPQKYKIRQGGLSSVFDDIIITLQENKPQLVQEFIDDHGVNPHYSLFVGNSVRSDGSTLTKTNFAYLPLESSLVRPTDEFPVNTGFELFKVNDWPEFEERAINRIIRRRKVAMTNESIESNTGAVVKNANTVETACGGCSDETV